MKTEIDPTYKERDAGNKELFSMLIYRPIAKFLLNTIFKHLNITPNQISFISLLVMIAASWFFAFTSYPLIIIGALLVSLGYVFDMLDGQYARYKGLSGKFGHWFDPFIDTIKAVFLFIGLSYGLYSRQNEALALLWGSVAMAQALLTFYVMNTRSQIIKGPTFEVKIGNIYIGYEISLYLTITAFVVVNRIYGGLIFLATVGALSWIKLYISLTRYYNKHKDEIENKA